MFLTIEREDGKKLVIAVSALCYIGDPVPLPLPFGWDDFLKGANIRIALPEETMVFSEKTRVLQ